VNLTIRTDWACAVLLGIFIKGLEVTVGIEFNVSILFGLEVSVKTTINTLVEVFMENSFVLFTCVWCGVAFLRAWLGTLPTQMRDKHYWITYLIQEKRERVQIPLPALYLGKAI